MFGDLVLYLWGMKKSITKQVEEKPQRVSITEKLTKQQFNIVSDLSTAIMHAVELAVRRIKSLK